MRSAARLPSLWAFVHPTTMEIEFFLPLWCRFVITRVFFCPLTMERYACQASKKATTTDDA